MINHGSQMEVQITFCLSFCFSVCLLICLLVCLLACLLACHGHASVSMSSQSPSLQVLPEPDLLSLILQCLSSCRYCCMNTSLGFSGLIVGSNCNPSVLFCISLPFPLSRLIQTRPMPNRHKIQRSYLLRLFDAPSSSSSSPTISSSIVLISIKPSN